MGKYVFAYKGGGHGGDRGGARTPRWPPGAPGSASLGDAVVDMGNPFGGSAAASGDGSNGAAGSGLTGYSIVDGRRASTTRSGRRAAARSSRAAAASTSTRRSRCSGERGCRAGRSGAAHPPARLGPSVALLGEAAEQLDDRGRRDRHVLDADPLAHRVVLVAAGEDVRGRQAHLGQPRAVGAAADRRRAAARARRAASPRAPPRRTCGTAVERLAHVAVLIPARRTSTLAPRLVGDRLLGEPADERVVLLELRRRRGRGGSASTVDARRRRPRSRTGGRSPRGPRSSRARACPRGRLSTNRAASLTGFTSFPFADARDGRRRRGRSTFSSIAEKVSFSISPTTCAVERVGEVGAELLEVEVVGAVADLLVDREADPRARPRHLGMRERARRRRP